MTSVNEPYTNVCDIHITLSKSEPFIKEGSLIKYGGEEVRILHVVEMKYEWHLFGQLEKNRRLMGGAS